MTNRRAGFLLFETLVAILIAAIFLSLLARVLVNTWHDNRRPMERISAVNVARNVAIRLASPTTAIARQGRIGAFDYESSIGLLAIEPRDYVLAPLPAGLAVEQTRHVKPAGNMELHRITIDVRSSPGRRMTFETVRLDRSK